MMTEKERKTVKRSPGVAKETVARAPRGSRGTGRIMAEEAKPSATAKTEKKALPAKRTAGDSTEMILSEVRTLKEMVGRLLPSAGEPDAVMDASADALRRLLSDLIERRLESVIKEAAEVFGMFAVSKFPNSGPVVKRMETLLGNLGAIRYEAERLDFIDPLIHNVVAERSVKDAPEGVILDTVRPGYRTARGLIVAKASVVVNRRS